MKANEVIEMFSTEYDICGGTSKNAGKYYWQIAKERGDSIESKKGSKNDRFLLTLGRLLPGTKIHAEFWIKNGNPVDCISGHQIWPVIKYCEKIGFVPEFHKTKSGNFVRITNVKELVEAVKKFFKI